MAFPTSSELQGLSSKLGSRAPLDSGRVPGPWNRDRFAKSAEIAERLWSKDVFVDVDHTINTAVRKVRQALREDPEKPRFVETVVGKGYRFAAPVICSNGDSTPQVPPLASAVQIAADIAAESTPAVLSAEEKVGSVRLWIVLAGVAILALLTSTLVLYRGRGAKATGPPPVKSLAVLPLKNLSGDLSQEYLADGMTEELIGRLSMIHGLRVISRTCVQNSAVERH